jgi:hypothetical protein
VLAARAGGAAAENPLPATASEATISATRYRCANLILTPQRNEK